MNTRYILMMTAAAALSCRLCGAAEITPEAKDMIRTTDLGRQEIVHRGDFLVREGHKLFEQKDYFGARDKYMEAIKLFRRYPSKFFQEKIEFCQKEIAACYYAKANEAADQADRMALASDFDEAIKICKEAIKYCPEQADELEKRVALYEKRRDTVVSRSAYSAGRLLPNKEAQDYQIQVLLEQARRLVAVKAYSAALVKYNEVLLIDPFNADATQGKRGVSRRIALSGNQRYVNAHRRAIAETEWKYAIPLLQQVQPEAVNTVADQPKPKNEELKKSPLRIKLDEIEIPGYSFTGQSLSAVLRSVQDMSRVNDLKEKRGVNIVYIPDARNADETPDEQRQREEARRKRQDESRQKKEAAKQRTADAEGQADAEDDSGEEEDNGKPVNLSGPKCSLYTLLNQICSAGDLNMQVEDFAVIITPKDVTLSNMELMTFPVTIDPKIAAMSPDEISKEIKMTLETKSDNRNIFPRGSSLYYNPSTKRLSITNTVENLRVLQGIIEQIYSPKTGTMVQIMIKLVDINQSDLDELAFNWQLAVNANTPRINPDGNASQRMIMDLNNPLLRYYTSAGDRATADIDGSLLSWVWEDKKGTRIVASMFALDQASSADVLMSPRVTVKDRHVAVVKMIETHNFPESEWNDIDVPEAQNAHFYATAQPSLENEQELGINFTVRPEVYGELIKLEVNVPFKTFAGWSEYDTRIYDKDGNVEDGNFYRMPILNTPELKTMVTVRDGETVIVGGVVSDETTSINDKIPILGDIPFIGRFFQSKGTNSSKRNLLVFLTCRLVKPDGTPVNPDPRQFRDGTYKEGYPRYGSKL